MRKMPIDKMLCVLERHADFIGIDVDENEDYKFITEAVTTFEVTDCVSYELKEQIYYKLYKLFQEFDLDYSVMLTEILLGE